MIEVPSVFGRAVARGAPGVHSTCLGCRTFLVLPSSLTVSVVTYRSDPRLLERCLDTLALAIAGARGEGVVKSVAVAMIDNSEDEAIAQEVMALTRRAFADSDVQL